MTNNHSSILSRAKLMLQRLNEDWSLTGDTFCHQTASILRRDITGDTIADLLNIQSAVAHMVKRYAYACDPYAGEYNRRMDPYNISRWNDMFAGANYMIDDVVGRLNYNDQLKIQRETILLYAKMF